MTIQTILAKYDTRPRVSWVADTSKNLVHRLLLLIEPLILESLKFKVYGRHDFYILLILLYAYIWFQPIHSPISPRLYSSFIVWSSIPSLFARFFASQMPLLSLHLRRWRQRIHPFVQGPCHLTHYCQLLPCPILIWLSCNPLLQPTLSWCTWNAWRLTLYRIYSSSNAKSLLLTNTSIFSSP